MKYGIRQLVSVAVCTGVLLGGYPLAAEDPAPGPALLQRIRERRDLPVKRPQPVRKTVVGKVSDAPSLPEGLPTAAGLSAKLPVRILCLTRMCAPRSR